MKLRHFYVLCCVIGILLPLRHFIPFLMEYGFDIFEFRRQIYATKIGAFFSADVAVSAVVLILFMTCEGKRLAMKYYLIPVIGLAVGVSLAFPWFLYLRQKHLDHADLMAKAFKSEF